jgi:hypothetical protein
MAFGGKHRVGAELISEEADDTAEGNGFLVANAEPDTLVHDSAMALNQEQLDLCEVYLLDALAGRVPTVSSDPAAVKRYKAYHRHAWRYAISFAVVFLLALALFEQPNGNLNTLAPWPATMVAELLIFAFLAWRMYQLRMILTSQIFWGDKKNLAVVGVIFVR